MNRTRGFVNLNRFKHGKTIKRFSKIGYDKPRKLKGKEVRVKSTRENYP